MAYNKSMKKLLIISLLGLLVVLGLSSVVQAADFQGNVMTQVGAAAGESGAGMGTAKDPQNFITDIIRIVLGAVGIIFTGLIFYGGILFLTAQGEEEQAKKGMVVVKASVIGLLVVLASYGIVLFVSNMVGEANVTEDYYVN